MRDQPLPGYVKIASLATDQFKSLRMNPSSHVCADLASLREYHLSTDATRYLKDNSITLYQMLSLLPEHDQRLFRPRLKCGLQYLKDGLAPVFVHGQNFNEFVPKNHRQHCVRVRR